MFHIEQDQLQSLPLRLLRQNDQTIDHPDVYVQLENGEFSVQLGTQKPFGRIPVDQTIKETVKKDTQTPRGTKGVKLVEK